MQEKIDEGGGGNSWIVFREKIGDIRIGMMESIDLGYECHSKMTENQIDFDCDKKAQTFRTFLYSSIVNPIDLYYEIIGSYLGVAKSWEDLSPEEKKETKIQTQEERNNPDYPYNSETCKKQDACNLLTAYNLKYQPKESFEKFFETYKDVMNVKILSREILPVDTFKVQVELEMIQNEEKERYEVVIKIIEGRLQTISSKRVK